jgi:DNA-binding transcriptional ArsR family regulator
MQMEPLLWQTLGPTRGGPNRLRLLQLLAETPRNANKLARETQLDYKTVRHHLDVLEEAGLIRRDGAEYGVMYRPTEQAYEAWETIEQIQGQTTSADKTE